MSDHQSITNDESPESIEERRRSQSARDVAEWEAALAAGKVESDGVAANEADRANAGALVSRAHRAEKTTAQPPEK